MQLSRAQLSMLLEGIDWRRVERHGSRRSQSDDNADSPVFMRVLWMIYCVIDGILRPWIALLFLI